MSVPAPVVQILRDAANSPLLLPAGAQHSCTITGRILKTTRWATARWEGRGAASVMAVRAPHSVARCRVARVCVPPARWAHLFQGAG